MKLAVAETCVELVEGDITKQVVDAIVNAANSQLRVGGGVDGAIHRAGGREIARETARRYPDGCPTGSAVISGGGELPAKHVIHAVGPVWMGGQHAEADELANAHRRSLELAVAHRCHSVAFPAISTGVFGYPVELAAGTALRTVIEFLRENQAPALVRFVLYDRPTLDRFAAALSELQ